MKIARISIFGLALLGMWTACSKVSTPTAPIHDTTTIIKTDTLIVPPPPDPTVNLKQGLLVYLPFNGSIADSSGNNNPTYAIGNVLTYDAHGYANSAFGNNGSYAKLVVINNGSIQFDSAFALSFDFMINVSPVTNRMSLVAMVDTAIGKASFAATLSLPGLPNLDFYANDSSNGCSPAGAADDGSVSTTAMTDTSIVPLLNTWYNVIYIYHKGSVSAYVNGRLTNFTQKQGTTALLCSNQNLVIGAWWNGDLIPLNGKMDEVRLYNRVLTSHEIAALSQHYQVNSEKVQLRVVKGR
jgi:hypothetical protein